MDQLKLAALDEEDLQVISAHAQDALMRIGDIDYSSARQWFLVPMNRFVRDGRRRLFRRQYERRRSVLHFERVRSVRSTGIDRGNIEQLDNFHRDYLHIFSREVLDKIKEGDPSWEAMVPDAVVDVIKRNAFFDYRAALAASA